MKKPHDALKATLVGIGCVLFGMGGFNIFLYVISKPHLPAVPMASETAIGFFLAGIAIILIAARLLPRKVQQKILPT